MRLIDADDFKKFMQALCKAGSPYESFIELLDKQTTAYDIDKVIEELEHTMSNDGLPGEIIWNNVLKIAIEIVKHGDVPDDVCELRLLNGHKFLHETSCGDVFDMQNGFKYCPYCGKKIKVVE